MNRKVLAKLLAVGIPKINNVLDNINNGGCLVFASQLQKALQRVNVSSQIHIVYVDHPFSDDEHKVRKMLRWTRTQNINKALVEITKTGTVLDDGSRESYAFSHCALKVDDEMYDSGGRYCDDSISDTVTDSTAQKLLKCAIWNPTFKEENEGMDVEKVMAKFLDKMLKGYKND